MTDFAWRQHDADDDELPLPLDAEEWAAMEALDAELEAELLRDWDMVAESAWEAEQAREAA